MRKETNPVKKGSFKEAGRLFVFLRPYRRLYAVSFFFLLLTSVTSMAFPLLMGQLLGTTESGVNNFSLTDFNNASSVVTLLFIIFIIQSFFSFMRIYLGSRVTENVLNDIRQTAYKRLISLPVSFFNKNKVGELTSRLSADISLLQETFNVTISEFIRQFIIIIIGVSALLFLSWKLSLIMLATVPVMALVAVFFGRFIKKLSREAQDKVAEGNTIVEETLTAISSVKAYANEFFEIGRYRKAAEEVKDLSIKGAVWRGAFVSFIILCMFGSIVFVMWQGVLLVQSGDIASEHLFTFVLYSVFIGASFGSIPELYAKIQKSIGATERLMELLAEKPEDITTDKPLVTTSRLRGAVEFKNIEFHYESRSDIPVLKNISFHVNPGEQVAIVGPSGSGKSTIASLLLRFYEPVSGSVYYDDKPASVYGISDLRNQMALVPQEVILFGGTIRENISYGKPGASDEEIFEAARKANAMEFIDRFPEKLDTVVGDRGVQLSGGQRQRIAIARAVLKDPSILILDEATSSLDSESEGLVQAALDKLMEGRTTFVIAHRFSTIMKADKILVIDHGVLREEGTHEELILQEEGLYKKLSRMQGMKFSFSDQE